ncbi:MAG: PfkB family carbohydrate kinase [Acidobacteriaceae bacterium]
MQRIRFVRQNVPSPLVDIPQHRPYRIAAIGPNHTPHAVDTTAAGDAFNAAFAVGLMLGYDPAESARYATTAASISVTRAGARPSMTTKEEVSAAFHPKL